jgi:hypothetical protein
MSDHSILNGSRVWNASKSDFEDEEILRMAKWDLEKKTHPEAASGAQREKMAALPYDLVPFQEITEAYVRVAEFGANKYAPWNWSKGLSRVQLLGSLLRHTFAYLRGEEVDRDSGLLHTDHILWNAAALVHNVHWHLEDGRRAEPMRAYKVPAAGGGFTGMSKDQIYASLGIDDRASGEAAGRAGGDA